MNLLPNAELFFIEGKKLVKKSTQDLFDGKDILLIGLTGAFMPNDEKMVKDFEKNYSKFMDTCLVGDPDQLLPIGSGGIWQILQEKETKTNLQSNSVKLIQSYRNKGDIALLRNTLKDEGVNAFWHLLSMKEDSSNISQYLSSLKSIPDPVVKTLFNYKKKLKKVRGSRNCSRNTRFKVFVYRNK